jgi:carboxymethylenebutenolidase
MLLAALLSAFALMTPSQAGPAPARDAALPPPAEQARAALDASPRHGEYVDVPMAGGPAIKTWISYPERKDKAGVVIVIQEVFGLTDWLRGVADQLAKEGFIAVAPDMVSGLGPGGGGTDSLGSRDDVVALVHKITPDEAIRRLNAVRAWALKIPAGNGKVATVGFCWGGGQSFAYAGAQPALAAAVVFYGVSPEPPIIDAIQAPVLGHYGGDDERVDATVPPAQAQMKKLGKSYEVHVYDGAGHGFLRDQSGRDGANLKATQQAWPRTVTFLKEKLGG